MARVTFDPYPISLSRASAATAVFRVNPAGGLDFLPNVVCLEVEEHEGPHPGTAQFRYVTDQVAALDDGRPLHFEQILPAGATGPLVVQTDDRIVVQLFRDDGSAEVLFDGFANAPELDLSEGEQHVGFLGLGSPIREWDTPLGGALVRDATNPGGPRETRTGLPARFNPEGKGNATADGLDVDQGGPTSHPCFMEPDIWSESLPNPREWSLAMAARYIIFEGNPAQTYVTNPDPDTINAVLDSWVPTNDLTMDPADAGSYQALPITISDYDCTGGYWPDELDKLIEPYGFGMHFRLETRPDGSARHALEVFRKDDQKFVKDLNFQAYGAVLDPGRTNFNAARITRETEDLFNRVVLDTEPVGYEVSVLLAPGFTIDPADATFANRQAFRTDDPNFKGGDNRNKYRRYVFDECGQGHWSFADNATKTDAPDLAAVLGKGKFALRFRPGKRKLFTVDANGEPLKAELWISRDFAGHAPAVWIPGQSSPGTWSKAAGGWELLDDRLGVQLTAEDVNSWRAMDGDAGFPSGLVNGVEWQAAAGQARFTLRLTCVIEGDQDLDATAEKRAASPTRFARTRRVDARDRFKKQVVSFSSHLNPGKSDRIARDDTADALAFAKALRRAHETGKVAGTITIPRITRAYRISDRVRSITGRNVDLAMNVGRDQGEAAIYPAVVGVRWSLDGGNHTHLTLSDRRADPLGERTR